MADVEHSNDEKKNNDDSLIKQNKNEQQLSENYLQSKKESSSSISSTISSSTISSTSNFMSSINNGKFLGFKFLKNERKNFEQEVERSMHQLLQQNLIVQNTDDIYSLLPEIQINIPNRCQDYVEIKILLKNNDSIINEHFQNVKTCNEDLFNKSQEGNKFEIDEKYLRKMLLVDPIRIPFNQLFLYRGQLDTPIERCLAMTTVLVLPQQQLVNRYQQCLVVQFESPAQVSEALNQFRQLQQKQKQSEQSTPSPQPPSILANMIATNINDYKVVINAELEIQEESNEGKWHSCPHEKDSFKLRANVDKRIIINLLQDITQFTNPIVRIQRCFGMLLSPGRNVSPNQMVAIGLNSMKTFVPNPEANPSLEQWQIIANWIPSELNSIDLNTETPRNSRVYFTMALDLVLEQVEEPVRFLFESKAKIIPPSLSTTEKLWKNIANLSKTNQRSMKESFTLVVKQCPQNDLEGRPLYQVLSCYSSRWIKMQKLRAAMQLKYYLPDNTQDNGTPLAASEDPEESDDEPLQSGTGIVNKECTQNELQDWQSILEKWNRDNLTVRPKQMASLIRKNGIPQVLRLEVWQLLSRANEVEDKILTKYKLFVMQDSPYNSIILRDISRTFTAHEFFRETGGQESLYRICKAYSNYDAEVGYCQGLSYLVAALLLNMPEEQSFCVLVQIMYRYGLRDLFKSGLENLHCKFFQLEALLNDHIPELYCHFADLHIETHMYASQWFLTLFTTKFPLNVVFMVIDLFLLDEMDVILQIALGLLQMAKNDLLAKDFEGVMKYFRITLPKIYRDDEAAKQLIRRSVKINVKKAKKYELKYQQIREENRDPLESLRLENKRLMQTTARLEQENDDLAQELLGLCQSMMKMKEDHNAVEDKAETLNQLLLQSRAKLIDMEEERKQLTEELKNLKDMYRKEMDRFDKEKQNDRKIIEEYKQICKNYQEKYENAQQESREKFDRIKESTKDCSKCYQQVEQFLNPSEADALNGDSGQNCIQDKEVDQTKQELYSRISDLEGELIKTKIALAESEDRYGELTVKLKTTNSELNLIKAQQLEEQQKASNTWLAKTLSTFRDATSTNKNQQSQILNHAHSNHPLLASSTSATIVKSSNSISSGLATNRDEQQQQQQQPIKLFRRNSSQSDH